MSGIDAALQFTQRAVDLGFFIESAQRDQRPGTAGILPWMPLTPPALRQSNCPRVS